MRAPEQIIGHDAVTQLIFEGYEIRLIREFDIGDHVADKDFGMWRGVVKSITPRDDFMAPGVAVVESGKGEPETWNITRLKRADKPDFVDWL